MLEHLQITNRFERASPAGVFIAAGIYIPAVAAVTSDCTVLLLYSAVLYRTSPMIRKEELKIRS